MYLSFDLGIRWRAPRSAGPSCRPRAWPLPLRIGPARGCLNFSSVNQAPPHGSTYRSILVSGGVRRAPQDRPAVRVPGPCCAFAPARGTCTSPQLIKSRPTGVPIVRSWYPVACAASRRTVLPSACLALAALVYCCFQFWWDLSVGHKHIKCALFPPPPLAFRWLFVGRAENAK